MKKTNDTQILFDARKLEGSGQKGGIQTVLDVAGTDGRFM